MKRISKLFQLFVFTMVLLVVNSSVDNKSSAQDQAEEQFLVDGFNLISNFCAQQVLIEQAHANDELQPGELAMGTNENYLQFFVNDFYALLRSDLSERSNNEIQRFTRLPMLDLVQQFTNDDIRVRSNIINSTESSIELNSLDMNVLDHDLTRVCQAGSLFIERANLALLQFPLFGIIDDLLQDLWNILVSIITDMPGAGDVVKKLIEFLGSVNHTLFEDLTSGSE